MWLEIQRTPKKECKNTQALDLLKKEEAFHDNRADIIDIEELNFTSQPVFSATVTSNRVVN